MATTGSGKSCSTAYSAWPGASVESARLSLPLTVPWNAKWKSTEIGLPVAASSTRRTVTERSMLSSP
jgi:hypothetical protein